MTALGRVSKLMSELDGTSDEASPRDAEQLMRATEVASKLGIRLKRVYELDIPAVRLGRRSLRWRAIDVARWIQERRVPR